MELGVLSLLFLLGAIAIGFFRKVNTGLVAIGLSLILGLIGDVSVKDITSGFPTSLFITLLGVMFLFSISQENGTLELLAKKTVSLAGKRTNLIPIIVFIFSAILAAVGPGTIPVMSLMAPYTCALAFSLGYSPLLLGATSVLGAAAGGISPIAPTGILGNSLAGDIGITGIGTPYFINSLIAQTVYFIVIYFVLKGHKMKSDRVLSWKELPKFEKNQMITIVGMSALVIGVIFFKMNVGLLAFTIGVLLLMMKVSNEKRVIAGIPWSTLILVTGVNVLMSVVIKLGGITLLANGLASIMIPSTAPTIIGVTAGIMSWFSSTSGVVMPTLIPTVNTVIGSVGGGVSAVALISAITNTAHVAGTSPISTGGSLGLASYVQTSGATEAEERKLFIQMFLIAIGGVFIVALVAATGVYTIF